MTPIFALPGSPVQILILILLIGLVVSLVLAATNKKPSVNYAAQSPTSTVHGAFTWMTTTFFNQIATFRASLPATAPEIYSGYATHFSQYLDALRSSTAANGCPPEYGNYYAAYLGYLAQSVELLRNAAASNANSEASDAVQLAETRVAELQKFANNLNALAQRYSL